MDVLKRKNRKYSIIVVFRSSVIKRVCCNYELPEEWPLMTERSKHIYFSGNRIFQFQDYSTTILSLFLENLSCHESIFLPFVSQVSPVQSSVHLHIIRSPSFSQTPSFLQGDSALSQG